MTVLLSVCLAVSLPAQQLQLPAEMVVTNRFANVRKGPGTGYDMLTTLYKGDRLRAERKYRNWLRVLIPDGRIGWVREDLLGPFSVDDLPLADEQADSLKQLTDMQKGEITSLEDSSRRVLGRIAEQEGMRDSLLAFVGMAQMPRADSTAAIDSAARSGQQLRKLPGTQESVLTQQVEYPRRFEFTPILGILAYEGKALPLAGMGVARNFSREFSYQAQVSFSRLNPPVSGSLLGDLNRYFFHGSLVYSYRPGSLAVPFAELGGGALHTQAGDSSYTAFDLVYGAGCRLYITPDLALKFGYQGHGVMVENNQLMHLFYLAADFNLPLYEDKFPLFSGRMIYLAPYFGYQVFSRRFGFNSAPVGGVRAGYRMTRHLAFEALSGYLPVSFNSGSGEVVLKALEFRVQALYHFWETMSGPYLSAGLGGLFLDEGRTSGNTSYSSFNFGGGFNCQLSPDVSIRSEVVQLLYPGVAEAGGRRQTSAGGAMQLNAGLNLNF